MKCEFSTEPAEDSTSKHLYVMIYSIYRPTLKLLFIMLACSALNFAPASASASELSNKVEDAGLQSDISGIDCAPRYEKFKKKKLGRFMIVRADDQKRCISEFCETVFIYVDLKKCTPSFFSRNVFQMNSRVMPDYHIKEFFAMYGDEIPFVTFETPSGDLSILFKDRFFLF